MTNLEWIDLHGTQVKHSFLLDLPSCQVSRLHLIHNTFGDWKGVIFKKFSTFGTIEQLWVYLFSWNSRTTFSFIQSRILHAKFHYSNLLLTLSIWTNTATNGVFFADFSNRCSVSGRLRPDDLSENQLRPYTLLTIYDMSGFIKIWRRRYQTDKHPYFIII